MRLLCFCLLAVWLSACSGTATPNIQPPTPTSSGAGCIRWSEVNASYKDKNICVFGEIVNIENAKGMGFYFIRFDDSATPKFYIMQNFEPEAQAGDCINITGTLQLDGSGVPFMDGSEIKTCPSEP